MASVHDQLPGYVTDTVALFQSVKIDDLTGREYTETAHKSLNSAIETIKLVAAEDNPAIRNASRTALDNGVVRSDAFAHYMMRAGAGTTKALIDVMQPEGVAGDRVSKGFKYVVGKLLAAEKVKAVRLRSPKELKAFALGTDTQAPKSASIEITARDAQQIKPLQTQDLVAAAVRTVANEGGAITPAPTRTRNTDSNVSGAPAWYPVGLRP